MRYNLNCTRPCTGDNFSSDVAGRILSVRLTTIPVRPSDLHRAKNELVPMGQLLLWNQDTYEIPFLEFLQYMYDIKEGQFLKIVPSSLTKIIHDIILLSLW